MAPIRIAVVGWARSRATSICPRSPATTISSWSAASAATPSVDGVANFTDIDDAAGARCRRRRGGAVHAAAGRATTRRRKALAPASTCCWKSRRARRSREVDDLSPGCASAGRDAVRHLAFALRRGRRAGARLAGRPHASARSCDRLEGGRAQLASGPGLDLGAGRLRRVRSGHQRAVDRHRDPAAADSS